MTPLDNEKIILDNQRQNNFDFIRIFAALCVVFSHQYALTGLREPSLLNVHSIGGFGVLLFFSLSGFLVAQSWDADPNVLRFSAKRLLRIWPGLALAVILAALVLGPFISTLSLHDYYSHPMFKDYFQNMKFSLRDQLPLTFVGNALPTAINGPLWTIPLELKCYLALGILGVTGLLRKRWIVTVLTLVVVFAYAVIEPRGDKIVKDLQWAPQQRFLLEFGMFFFAGVLFHKFSINATRRRAFSTLALCWIAACVAFMFDRIILSFWLVIPVTILLIGTASTPYIRQTGRFGDFSYGMYIYAFPVQQTLIWLYKDKLSWLALFVLVLGTSFGLAFASWHLVEKRALRLKPRRKTAIYDNTDKRKLSQLTGVWSQLAQYSGQIDEPLTSVTRRIINLLQSAWRRAIYVRKMICNLPDSGESSNKQ